MTHPPKVVATVAAPIFARMMADEKPVPLDDVFQAIAGRARIALSHARILLSEAERHGK